MSRRRNRTHGEGVYSDYRTLLRRQRYQLVGSHSAVKSCMWLSRAMRGGDMCYKGRFYGIRSHRCVQMSPYIGCNQRCMFCWRPGVQFSPERIDSPSVVAEGVLEAHRRLLWGYKGAPTTDQIRFREALSPLHVAISLIGEPTLYPYLPALIREFSDRGMSTFVVSNATQPEMLKKISPTMLYLSLDAPSELVYEKVCRPQSKALPGGAGWDRVIEGLEVTGERSDIRKTIRVTLVNGFNDIHPEDYARLILLADPDFVEVKAYMHVGYSRKRLSRDAMPSHEQVHAFASKLAEHLGYHVRDQSPISRIVLLSREWDYERLFPPFDSPEDVDVENEGEKEGDIEETSSWRETYA